MIRTFWLMLLAAVVVIPTGCFNLDSLFGNGEWNPSAAELYGQACTGGEAVGCLNLGVRYQNGEGVGKDLARAAELYGQACTGGEAQGCYNLGVLYRKGDGVEKDLARAAELYEQACTIGFALGCSNLGSLYDNGEGVGKDLARAAELYGQACTGGFAGGCLNLGVRYQNGEGVGKDLARAVELYGQACTGGEAVGCLNLGVRYQNGEGVGKDLARAGELYGQACTGGEARGCLNLGLLYDHADAGRLADARAAELYDQACTGGEARGCLNLDLLVGGKDLARAAERYGQACTGGAAQGCSNLGWVYQIGEGVGKDPAKSKRYYAKACEMGDQEACNPPSVETAYIELDPSDIPENSCVYKLPLRLWLPAKPKPGDFSIHPQKSFGPLKSDEIRPERVLPRLGWVFQSNTVYTWFPPDRFKSTQAALKYMKTVWMKYCDYNLGEKINIVNGGPGKWAVSSHDPRIEIEEPAIKLGQSFSKLRQRFPEKPISVDDFEPLLVIENGEHVFVAYMGMEVAPGLSVIADERSNTITSIYWSTGSPP